MKNKKYLAGKHFVHIPGPTNIPDRVLRAMDKQIIDHRGPEFSEMAVRIIDNLKKVVKTKNHLIIYPASGTGAWESAIANTLSPGDKVLVYETGHFSNLWIDVARKFKLEVDVIPSDWRSGAKIELIEKKLIEDKEKKIKALMMVHNETSSGVKYNIQKISQKIQDLKHPCLLMVDTVSSLASSNFENDEWKVDVMVGGSQKGLMLPPGIAFNTVSPKALEKYRSSTLPKYFWDWEMMIENNKNGFFPYTPAVNLMFGLEEAMKILNEEGLDNVFSRHTRLANATRKAVEGWGLEIFCNCVESYSDSCTTIFSPKGIDPDHLRSVILNEFNISLGMGLSKIKGKVFRIGHLGDLNEVSLIGVLGGIEMGLSKVGYKIKKSGTQEAINYLAH